MATRELLLLLAVLGRSHFVASGNHYCEYDVPAGTIVRRFEGKMNVPQKPLEEPGKVLFLWPGLNPYGGQGGMMQPVLTYGVDYGQGAGKWGMANWFTNCDKEQFPSGYCHDAYQAVEEGEILLFSMQFVKKEPINGTEHWDMHWNVKGHPLRGSTFRVVNEQHDPACFWATEAEFYLNTTDPSNWAKLPASPYYTWDLKATTADGKDLPLIWTTHGDNPGGGDIRVNCSSAGSFSMASGTTLKFPDPERLPTAEEIAAALRQPRNYSPPQRWEPPLH